jgi:phosphoglycolate phosphatase-like HAD superfamily hydrolase
MGTMKKLFVWDFHGTLEKGNELAALEISNRVLEKFGYKVRFTEQEGRDLYGKKWYEYFEYLLPDEPHETHVKLQHASFTFPGGQGIVRQYLQPNDFVEDALNAVVHSGHDQIVISNTHPQAILDFIDAAQLTDYFGPHNTFAVMAHLREVKRPKTTVLKEYMATKPGYQEIITIGDSPKDMELVGESEGRGYLLRRPGREFRVSVMGPHVRIIDSLQVVADEVAANDMIKA